MGCIRRVGFIRNVMVGRQGLTRQRLLQCFEQCGAENPRSHISTGNVTFCVDDVESFVLCLQAAIASVIGRTEELFVRDLAWLRQLDDQRPFQASVVPDIYERLVCFAQEPIPEPAEMPLTTKRGDAGVFRVDGREAFAYTRLVDGRTQSPLGLLERTSGLRLTTRNWNTIERILDKEG